MNILCTSIRMLYVCVFLQYVSVAVFDKNKHKKKELTLFSSSSSLTYGTFLKNICLSCAPHCTTGWHTGFGDLPVTPVKQIYCPEKLRVGQLSLSMTVFYALYITLSQHQQNASPHSKGDYLFFMLSDANCVHISPVVV